MYLVVFCRFVLCLSALGAAYGQASAPPGKHADDFEGLARQAAAAVDARPAEAVTLYREALTLKPEWPEGWFYLGASEYQMQHFDRARRAFLRASELAPENGPATAFLGLAEYETGDYRRAREHLARGTQLGTEGNPKFSAIVLTHFANLLCRDGLFGPALLQLEPLARLGDQSEPVVTAFGLAVLQKGGLPVNLSAPDRQLVTTAGQAVWTYYAGQSDRAATLFQQLTRKFGDRPGVHYAYGMFLVPNNPTLALAELTQELKQNPQHLQSLVQSSVLELKLGNTERAQEFGARAVRLGPGDAMAHVAFGRALLKDGRALQAVSELEQGVGFAPAEPLFHLYLEQAYRKLGNTAKADAEKKAFLELRAASPEHNLTMQSTAETQAGSK